MDEKICMQILTKNREGLVQLYLHQISLSSEASLLLVKREGHLLMIKGSVYQEVVFFFVCMHLLR